jgi:hypothetical protein
MVTEMATGKATVREHTTDAPSDTRLSRVVGENG